MNIDHVGVFALFLMVATSGACFMLYDNKAIKGLFGLVTIGGLITLGAGIAYVL